MIIIEDCDNVIIMAHRNSCILDASLGHWFVDAGRLTLDSELSTLDSKHWIMSAELWMLESGRWARNNAGH